MADKTYNLKLRLSNNTEIDAGNFTVPQGESAKTPVKGVDYYTEAEKAAFVSEVIAALPTWTGGSY